MGPEYVKTKWGPARWCVGCQSYRPTFEADRCDGCVEAPRLASRSRQYGLPPHGLDDLFIKQNGRCAICPSCIMDVVHVDHDHACCDNPRKTRYCGKCVRGLLCPRCNQGLGQFYDDPQRLRAAADYLEARTLEST